MRYVLEEVAAVETGRFLEVPDGLIGRLGSQAAEKEITITFEVADDLQNEMVYGDQVRLVQTAGNIIANAVKFTGKGSVQVQIFRRDQDRWGIEIKDTGPGMSQDVLSHSVKQFDRMVVFTDNVEDLWNKVAWALGHPATE